MPRGFLVKRNRRGSATYRTRSDGKPEAHEGERSGARAQVPALGVFPFHRPDGELPESEGPVREAWSPHVESALEAEADRSAQLPDTEVDVLSVDGDFCFYPPPPPRDPALNESCSPVKPDGTRLPKRHEEADRRDLPFLVRSAQNSVSASMERLRLHAQPYSHKFDPNLARVHLFPPLTLMEQEQERAERKRSFLDADHHKLSAKQKKPKPNRRLNFEDEVTTSPVLGLRIKKESPELRRPREKPSAPPGTQPLGEFICQLCKEEYPDPFSLAQHKCSRIVRVEYRCPECDKVFSCPANLASHRRWHKPRPANNPEPEANRSQALKEARALVLQEKQAAEAEAEGKENELQHHGALDSSARVLLLRPDWNPDLQHVRAADSPPSGLLLLNPEERAELPQQQPPVPFLQSLPEEEVYECRYCGKKFRRQAYLKKHLAAHEMTARASPPPSPYNQTQVFLCHLCGARFPSAEIRDKHRLWHAMRDELLVGAGRGRADVFHAHREEGGGEREAHQQQIFTCKYCPSTFFSSPGLTRHINKSHPTENRQVMLLQMTVRP